MSHFSFQYYTLFILFYSNFTLFKKKYSLFSNFIQKVPCFTVIILWMILCYLFFIQNISCFMCFLVFSYNCYSFIFQYIQFFLELILNWTIFLFKNISLWFSYNFLRFFYNFYSHFETIFTQLHYDFYLDVLLFFSVLLMFLFVFYNMILFCCEDDSRNQETLHYASDESLPLGGTCVMRATI